MAIPAAEQLREIGRLREGSLETVPFSVLLHALALGGRTAMLSLEPNQMRKTIVLDDGVPVDCRSNLAHETLGRFMGATGKLSPEDDDACLKEAMKRHLDLARRFIPSRFVGRDLVSIAEKARDVFLALAWSYGEPADPDRRGARPPAHRGLEEPAQEGGLSLEDQADVDAEAHRGLSRSLRGRLEAHGHHHLHERLDRTRAKAAIDEGRKSPGVAVEHERHAQADADAKPKPRCFPGRDRAPSRIETWRSHIEIALRAVLLVGALCTTASAAPADEQRPDVRFSTLSSANGLSDDDVRAIHQDRQGFMWFGTRFGGLNRYDGYQFKVYQSDLQDSRSLSNNFVWVLHEDRRGTLWVGTNGGGLDRYDRDTDSFVHFRHDPQDPRSLPHDNVKSLFEDAKGAFWVGSDGGLSRFDRDSGTFVTYRHDPKDPTSLGDDSVRSIVEDVSNGLLWLGTRRGGLNVLDRATGRFTRFVHDPHDSRSVSDDAVEHVLQDHRGALWLSTRAGLDLRDPANGQFVRHRHDPREDTSLGDDYATMTHEDKAGRLWVATLNGLDLLDGRRRAFLHFRHDPADPDSIGDDDLNALYEDATGALWIGTQHGGVSRLALGGRGFVAYRESPHDPRSLSHNAVQAVLISRTGTLWVGTADGLNRFENGGFTRLRSDPADPKSLSADDVRSLAEDAAGNLWVGTRGGGLDRLSGRVFTHFRKDPADAASLAGDFIDTVHVSASGEVFIAVHGVGLDRFDGKTFTHYAGASGPGGLPSRYVLSIVEAPGGALWLGTTDMGLVHFDPRTSVFTPHLLDPRRPGSEASNRVHVIYPAANGELWLGTDGGLFSFDSGRTLAPGDRGSSGFTRHFTRSDGLPSNTILGILGDERGFLWLSTSVGLVRCSPDAGNFRTYDRGDGLPSNVFTARAQARADSGRMYFGGSGGLTAFDPGRLTDNPHVPPVVLTDLELIGGRLETIGSGSPLRRAIHVADELTLQHDQSVFGVRFAALDYTAPQKNRYAYRMEGFDRDWRLAGADGRIATYTNLDPGRYVLRVRGSNNDGVWNQAGAMLRVVIVPPWWATWWFRTLAAAAVLGLVLGAHHVRVRTLEESERRFRTLAEHERDVVVRFDRDLRLRYISPAAEEHTGQASATLLGKTCADLGVPAESLPSVEAALRRVLETGAAGSHELEVETPRGRRCFEARVVPEVGRDGARTSVLGIVRDVTERRQAEEERTRFRESLRRSQAMASMGALVAGVAHEVRNPLFAISATLDALEARTTGENPYRSYSEVLRAQVERLNKLTHELLAYGRPQAPELALLPVDVVIAEALAACQPLARHAGVRLESRVATELPLVRMDRSRLLQVFHNLVENAIQHSAASGTVSVHADLAPDQGATLQCSIEDGGPGFDEGDLPHVFEPFFTRREGGTGLGLSIVQRIVEDHGGTVVAANRPGGGAVLRVSLPVTVP